MRIRLFGHYLILQPPSAGLALADFLVFMGSMYAAICLRLGFDKDQIEARIWDHCFRAS